jgi:hypothetical protein
MRHESEGDGSEQHGGLSSPTITGVCSSRSSGAFNTGVSSKGIPNCPPAILGAWQATPEAVSVDQPVIRMPPMLGPRILIGLPTISCVSRRWRARNSSAGYVIMPNQEMAKTSCSTPAPMALIQAAWFA